MIPHTRTILGSPTTHKHNAVLLDIMTLAGYVGRDDSARGKLDTSRFALARVRLLGAHDADS